MNYTTLTGARTANGSIKNWGKHALIDADQVLTEAQAWIYSRLRALEMQESTAVALLEDEDEFTLPAGFQATVHLRLDGDRRDLPLKHEALIRFRDSEGNLPSGRPGAWTITEGKAQFDRMADQDYDGLLVFYGTPAALSAGNPTNFLCTRFPSLLRKVCTAYAYEDRENWKAADGMFRRALEELEAASVTSEDYRRTMQLRE